MKVGFVGLGIMGRPMAMNLLKGGHTLAVWARRAESMKPLTDAGAHRCGSPEDVARQSEAVFTMVSDTPDVEAVILGPDGIIHGAAAGTVVVDMSTISAAATRDIAQQLRSSGVEMLDAPVSGGEAGAVAGTLSIMVGGPAEVFERMQQLLACMGKNIVHIGDNGAGQVAKSCNQIVAAVTLEAVAEALTLARRNGVDPVRAREALLGGYAWSKVLEVHGKRMLERDFKPGFKSRLHRKDLRIVTDIAAGLDLFLPQTELVAGHLAALAGLDGGEQDSAALVRVLERMAGEER